MAHKKVPATEKTAKGIEVPIPKRRDFMANLKKIAKPNKASGSRGPQK